MTDLKGILGERTSRRAKVDAQEAQTYFLPFFSIPKKGLKDEDAGELKSGRRRLGQAGRTPKRRTKLGVADQGKTRLREGQEKGRHVSTFPTLTEWRK